MTPSAGRTLGSRGAAGETERPAAPSSLPAHPPRDPAALLAAWLAEARDANCQPNPDAMSLATARSDGRPSARIVLWKGFDPVRLAFTFYTDRSSRKGRELEENAWAAAVRHWDALGRQVRIEGPVTAIPGSEADDYFAGRPRESQLSAWASEQGRPIASRAALAAQHEAATARFLAANESAEPVPRPRGWVGYRLWAQAVELWSERPGRLHDRLAWRRELRVVEHEVEAGPWVAQRLQP